MTVVTLMRTVPVCESCRAASVMLGLLLCAGLTRAQDSTPVQETTQRLRDDVQQWVDELDAPSLETRRSAEQSLIKSGPEALEFIPESIPDLSIEATERLGRVRKTLRTLRAKAETSQGPSMIRLGDSSTLQEALDAITRDSGVEFEYDASESLPIEPVNTPLTFWHALDLVLDQTSLDINFYGGDSGILQLVQRGADRPSRVDSAVYTGVYRLEPMSVTANRNLVQPSLSGLNISLHLSWEPKTTPIGLTIPVAEIRGALDDQAPLQPQVSAATINIATNADLAFTEFYLPMNLPAGRPNNVTALSGVIRALIPGKQRQFELELGKPGISKKIDAMTVQVEDVRRSGALTLVRIGVELEDADRSLESHRHWIFENEVFVQLKDGSRAEHLGYERYRGTESGVGVGYLFDIGESAGEASVIYRSPTAVVPNEVSFQIQDISLP